MGKSSVVVSKKELNNIEEIKGGENLFRKYCENNIKKRKRINLIIKSLLFLCATFGILMLAILILSIFKDGLKFLSIDFLTNSASRIASESRGFTCHSRKLECYSTYSTYSFSDWYWSSYLYRRIYETRKIKRNCRT